MEVNLGEITTNLSFPVGEPVDEVILAADTKITAFNNVTLVPAGVGRIGPPLLLTWSTENPGNHAAYVHVGSPPVISDDGIFYGYYESPDIASAPITPAGGSVEWTTRGWGPRGRDRLIVLPSVESKQQRLLVNYALDVSGD